MSTDWAGAVRLDTVEFLACWAALDLGDLPPYFDLRPVASTPAERADLYRAALDALEQRGVHERLAAMLRLVAAPRYEANLRCTGWNGIFIALSSIDGERGVVTVLDGGQFTVLATSGPRAPAALIELIGPLQPGRARAVNIPAVIFDRACECAAELWSVADNLAATGVERGEANSVARMLTGITAGGQFGASDCAGGVRRRGRWVIGYHRTSHGDFTQLRRPDHAGGETIMIAPTDSDQLFRHLRELVGSFAPAGR